MRKTTFEEVAAMHEASHAVIAAWIGVPLGETSIVPDEKLGIGGRVDTPPRWVKAFIETPNGGFIPDECTNRPRLRAEQQIMVLFAGIIGQKMHYRVDDGKDDEDASYDLDDVRRLAERFHISEERLDALRSKVAKMLASTNVYFALRTIAERLIEQKRLSAKEVRKTVRAWKVGGMGAPRPELNDGR